MPASRPRTRLAILLALGLSRLLHADPGARSPVRVFEWTEVPGGVVRRPLADAHLTIRDGQASLRLARGDERGPEQRVEVILQELQQARPLVRVLDLSGRTPPSPPVRLPAGAGLLRVERTEFGYAVYAASPEHDEPESSPRAGAWELELERAPPPMEGFWDTQLSALPAEALARF